MFKKKYIFTIIETGSNKAHSALLNKSTIILIIIAVFAVAATVTLPFSHGITQANEAIELKKLQKENAILREAYDSWKQRISSIQNTMDDLKEKNQHLMGQKFSNIPAMELGVGGPESMPRISILAYPDIKETDNNLIKLEAELHILKKNMGDIEEVIARRTEKLNHYPSVKPVSGGWYSSAFGERKDPFTGKKEFHPGLDICVPEGSDVIAPAAGIVTAVRHSFVPYKGYGKYVIIDHGYGYKTLYGHLSKIRVIKGQKVKRGQVIALSGNTGKSTSAHLHYEVMVNGKPQNPFHYILD